MRFALTKTNKQTNEQKEHRAADPSRSLKGTDRVVACPEHACDPGPTVERACKVLSSRVLGLAEPRAPDPLCHLRAGWLFFPICQRAAPSPARLGVRKTEHKEALHGHSTRTALGKRQLPSLGSRGRTQCLS